MSYYDINMLRHIFQHRIPGTQVEIAQMLGVDLDEDMEMVVQFQRLQSWICNHGLERTLGKEKADVKNRVKIVNGTPQVEYLAQNKYGAMLFYFTWGERQTATMTWHSPRPGTFGFGPTECEFIHGKCWGDVSYTIGKEWYDILMTKGSTALQKVMLEAHKEYFGD